MKKLLSVLAALILVVFTSTLCLAETKAAPKEEAKQTPQVTVGAAAPATALPSYPARTAAPQAADPVKTPAPPQARSTAKTVKPAIPPPAGKDMVWVNMESKIFHKSWSKWYGKTKQGSYMTQSEAIMAGYREAK